jgi:hypothetical protein
MMKVEEIGLQENMNNNIPIVVKLPVKPVLAGYEA